MSLSVVERPSPNSGARRWVKPDSQIEMLVVHYTGMATCEDALNRLCDPAAEVSAHYLVDQDGTVYQLVSEGRRAWHAGTAYWRGISDVNSASIGVELVNPGHEYGYCAFPEVQTDAALHLCLDIVARHAIPSWGIVCHSDIAPGRKTDPGELFPWRSFAASGVGAWPENAAQPSGGTIWDHLSAIGYARPGSAAHGGAILDPLSGENDVISAFQRRYRPDGITGTADAETLALAANVAAALT